MDESTSAPSEKPAAGCPYCLVAVTAADETETCPNCHAVYHRDCWQENGGCAVYGCTRAPVVEPRKAIEVPIAYWGQENKPCPACGQQILAAAKRCRHCGTEFASAQPEGRDAYLQRTTLELRLPQARRQVRLIFALSIFPFTAPIGGIWGWLWLRGNEDELNMLPSLYGALFKIGRITAIVLTAAVVVAGLLYAWTQAG